MFRKFVSCCVFSFPHSHFIFIPHRIFRSCVKFYTPTNTFSSRSKSFTPCPTHFLPVRKSLRHAQVNFSLFENFYSLPKPFLVYKIFGKWLSACCRSRHFPCIIFIQSLIPIHCRNGVNYRDCTFWLLSKWPIKFLAIFFHRSQNEKNQF